MAHKKTKVFVAVSGGVDSSVALALLKDDGYDVTGIYFKSYKPSFTKQASKDYCKQQGMDAQAVCKHLGVPFKVFDLQEEYKQKVFDYMIEGYQSGQTPNPDIMCNKEIKFGIFAKQAFALGADFIATGHYARVVHSNTPPLLRMAKDANKDQTYFLSQVSQEVLHKTMFPLGTYKKNEVRELAKSYGLLTADKKDSQGICFIGQEIDVKSFLKKYIKEEIGNVLDISGEIIGTHNGAKLITIGERHGFTIDPTHKMPNMPRLFVIKRNIKENSITVGTKVALDEMQVQSTHMIPIDNIHWVNDAPEKHTEYTCRIRHRGGLYRCKVKLSSNPTWENMIIYEVEFIDIPYAPASGQFLAVYDGDICLGGGALM